MIVKVHMSFVSGMARDGLSFKAMPSICVFNVMHLSGEVRLIEPQEQVLKTTVRCAYTSQTPTRSMSGILR